MGNKELISELLRNFGAAFIIVGIMLLMSSSIIKGVVVVVVGIVLNVVGFKMRDD